MNPLKLFRSREPEPIADNLEDLLQELSNYGLPRLMKFDDGTWHCKIDVFISPQGASFEISSGFNNKTHREAARVCLARLYNALKEMTS